MGKVGGCVAVGKIARSADVTDADAVASPTMYRVQSLRSCASVKKKLKEADLYSAFVEVPYTQGAEVRITQCYLQTTPYLPLPRKHSPDGASQTEVADI